MSKRLNRNPAMTEEVDERTNAQQALDKVHSSSTEQAKVPLWINSATTIFVARKKATNEYREIYIKKMNKAQKSYER